MAGTPDRQGRRDAVERTLPAQFRHYRPRRLGQLLRDIDGYTGHFSTLCALKLSPLVFIRSGELRAAKWADVDLEAGTRGYAPSKTRNQTQLEHVIPLPTHAAAILKEIHAVTGRGAYVFRGSGKSGYLSKAAILNALYAAWDTEKTT